MYQSTPYLVYKWCEYICFCFCFCFIAWPTRFSLTRSNPTGSIAATLRALNHHRAHFICTFSAKLVSTPMAACYQALLDDLVSAALITVLQIRLTDYQCLFKRATRLKEASRGVSCPCAITCSRLRSEPCLLCCQFRMTTNNVIETGIVLLTIYIPH